MGEKGGGENISHSSMTLSKQRLDKGQTKMVTLSPGAKNMVILLSA